MTRRALLCTPPTPAQERFLRTGQGTAATLNACRCASWCDRAGELTEHGRWILRQIDRVKLEEQCA